MSNWSPVDYLDWQAPYVRRGPAGWPPIIGVANGDTGWAIECARYLIWTSGSIDWALRCWKHLTQAVPKATASVHQADLWLCAAAAPKYSWNAHLTAVFQCQRLEQAYSCWREFAEAAQAAGLRHRVFPWDGKFLTLDESLRHFWVDVVDLDNMLTEVHREACRAVAAFLAAHPARQGSPRRRRRTTERQPRRITPKQIEAVHLVNDLGTVSAAAREAGISRWAMQKRYDAGMEKLGRDAAKPRPKPKTLPLPVDRRGQATVIDNGR